jgi:hypothetical protein
MSDKRRPANRRTDDADAFIPDPDGGRARTSDDLAETLAEDFVASATSGESVNEEVFDSVVPEETGGPFVETSSDQEFAHGTDESNPSDAETEPLPLANAAMNAAPDADEEEEPET